MEALTMLAAHNQWANSKIFEACSEIGPTKLGDASHGYDSVIGILNHLVQVENSFYELAHGREPRWTQVQKLADLRLACSRLDQDYLEYASKLEPEHGAAKKPFLVPWFGFEITLVDGALHR